MDKLNRRRFLEFSGGNIGLLALAKKRLEASEPLKSINHRQAANASTFDVAVIGAGAFGGWAALYLREMGLSVALIDAYGPGNARAASGGETRQIRAGYGEREIYTRWVLEAFKRWEARQEEWGGLPLFYRTGQLSLYREGGSRSFRATQTVLTKLGVENEVIEHDEVARQYPQFNLDGIDFGYYLPSTGVLMARRGCFAVAEDFQRKGGEFILAKAKPGRQSGRQLQEITLSTGQTISAENFVFACGPWLPKVLPNPMKDRLVTPRRATFWYGVPPDDNRFSHPNCPNFSMAGVYGFPSIEGRGLKFATVYDSIPFDPDTDERLVTENEVERAREFLNKWFPALRGQPLLESRVCQYETSVDDHFIVDHHPDMENVWIVGGGSGHGYKHGIMLGDYVARRVTGQATDPELDATFKLKAETF
jgi:glycine/D-amino acid oxidase-like deaminating enzyme